MLCQGSILPPQTFRFTGPQLHGPSASDDLEVPLQFPVGDAVQPLAPFPFAGCGEVVDEVVAEPVARHLDAFKIRRGSINGRGGLGAFSARWLVAVSGFGRAFE